MRVPAECSEIIYIDDSFPAYFRWRIAIERRVDTMTVVEIPEFFKLSVQVSDIPKEYVV